MSCSATLLWDLEVFMVEPPKMDTIGEIKFVLYQKKFYSNMSLYIEGVLIFRGVSF